MLQGTNLPTIEGLTPSILWITLAGIVGILGVALIIFKVIEFTWKVKDRRVNHTKESDTDLTEDIAQKVMEKMEPKFEEINKKLKADKDRLDNHEETIKSFRTSQKILTDGMSVTCDALMAILDHELHNGNSDQMQKARDDLHKYTTGLINKFAL